MTYLQVVPHTSKGTASPSAALPRAIPSAFLASSPSPRLVLSMHRHYKSRRGKGKGAANGFFTILDIAAAEFATHAGTNLEKSF